MQKIIMPLVVKQSLSPSAIAIATAHASLAGYLKWKDSQIVQDWVNPVVNKAFFKRLYKCKFKDVNKTEIEVFDLIKKWNFEHIILTESKLDNLETIIVFKPVIWSNSIYFNELELY